MSTAPAMNDILPSSPSKRGPTTTDKAIDLSHHLSLMSKSRSPSPLKEIIKYMAQPGMVSLAGGLPHPSLFPYQSVTTQAFSPDTLVDPDDDTPPTLQTFTIPRDETGNRNTLSIAMQYTGGSGSPELSQFCRDFTAKVFPPAYADWEVLIHSGNTDAWAKVVQLLCEPGEYILTEQFVYPSAQAYFVPLGCKAAPVAIDGDGLIPQDLEEILREWDTTHPGTKRPHVLYTVPVGQNPCGCTLTVERKREIYEIAVKYDLIIVEDDPYYWLQLPEYHTPEERVQLNGHANDSPELVPTFLSMDYQGRVIHLDTFSKTIAPGSRLGFFVCNPLFTERLLRATEVTTQAPSGWSQAITLELLKKWGIDGYVKWLSNLKDSYTTRRNWMCDAISRHFTLQAAEPITDGLTAFVAASEGAEAKTDGRNDDADEREQQQSKKKRAVMSFVPPKAGMFIWCKFHITEDEKYRRYLEETTSDREAVERWSHEFWLDLIKNNVLLTPGSYYLPFQGHGVAGKTEEATAYFRLAYSYESREDIEKGIANMAKVIREYWE